MKTKHDGLKPLPNYHLHNKYEYGPFRDGFKAGAIEVCDEYAAPAYAEIERLNGEVEESRRKLEHAKLAIILAKEQYWNKCYQGSGNVQAMTLNKFTAFMEEALKSIGVES